MGLSSCISGSVDQCVAFLDMLEPVDLVRASFIVAWFLYTVGIDKSREAWFRMETAAVLAFGLLSFLVPEVLFDIQVSPR